MGAPETELEMVRRHVREGETHVSRQLEIIAEMTLRLEPTDLAERLLMSFERTLSAHQTHLSKLI